MTVNDALLALALESVAEHLTLVRPTLNRLPDRGVHVDGTLPSTTSFAVTVYVTRAWLAPSGARTVRGRTPSSTGGITSNSCPGSVSIPVQVSDPNPPLIERSTVPLPVTPA